MNEIWKPVLEFEGLYEVSNRGRVRVVTGLNHGHYRPGRVMKPGISPQGYLSVALWKQKIKVRRTVHSLVLEAFIGRRPNEQECRHLDGDRQHNCLTNLVWGTTVENHADKKLHGTSNCGERHGMAKLDRDAVFANQRIGQQRKAKSPNCISI